jgi:hypothetical protein
MGRNRREEVVYNYGVRGWGIVMFFGLSALFFVFAWRIDSRSAVFMMYIAALVLPLSLTVTLWAGYIFGSMMNALHPSLREASTERSTDLPPAVCNRERV